MDNFYTEIQKEIHENAKEKGWHDTERSYLEYAALFNCEIAEASEEFRAHKPAIYYVIDKYGHSKPEGWAVEWADLIIRILDYFGKEYNKLNTSELIEKSKFAIAIEHNELEFNEILHCDIAGSHHKNMKTLHLIRAIARIEVKYPEIREVIKIKMEYNKTRPYRHGNKKY